MAGVSVKRFGLVVALVAASAVAVVPAASAVRAPGRAVPPQRWVREVCNAWAKYADTDVASPVYEAAYDVRLGEVGDSAKELKKVQRKLVEGAQDLVRDSAGVVKAVQTNGAPRIENGAQLRRNYLATVKEYESANAALLAAVKGASTASSAAFALDVIAATDAFDDEVALIGYDPLEELKGSPELAGLIDGAAACQEVADWIDLGYLSDVEIGECWDVDGLVVDCAAPHDAEVFLQVEHPAARGEPYPGSDAIDAYASGECLAAFAGYVGRDYESSSFDFAWLVPDQQDWDANDREVLCLLVSADGSPLSAPARGSGA